MNRPRNLRKLLCPGKVIGLASATVASMCFAGGVAWGDAQSFGGPGPEQAIMLKAEQPGPLSEQLGLKLGIVPQVALGPVNVDALLQEDGGCEGKCLRVGIGRAVDVNLSHGQWMNVPGGMLWVADVVAQGALGIRLHLSQINLPEGARLVVYAPDWPADVAGPYQGHGLFDNGQLWTPDLMGERARIECFVPVEKPGALGNFQPFVVDQLQHLYRDVMAPMQQDGIAGATGCADVTCFPVWANISHACARISFVDGGTFLCSGTLVNSQNGDLTPYFLTAHHCISTNAVANTTTFYWFFQTSTCNGTPPNIATVPKSNVATLLSTGASSDYTLLMVEGSLPCGLYWSGFNTAVANGAACVCISHPDGSWKRIAFGTKQNGFGCGGSNHIGMAYTGANGTEPGSSGGGMFRSDTQQIVGQLHCGPSSCNNPSSDDYGALSSSYPSISGLLTGGSDDGLEPNDSCGTAFLVSEGTYGGLIVKSGYDDWYKINLAGGAQISITLNFTHAYGDVDMQLWNSCGGSVVASSTGVSDSEFISYTNTGGSSNFFLHVYLADCDTRNGYSMTLSGSLVNDHCANATVIPSTALSFTPAPYSTTFADASGGEPQESCEFGGVGVSNSVWYTFTPCGNGTINLNTIGSNYDTVLSVFSDSCASSIQVACNDDIGGGNLQSQLNNVAVSGGTTYLIKVADYNLSSGGGTLDFNFSYGPTPPANDMCTAPTIIPPNTVRYHPANYCTVGANALSTEPQETCGAASNSNSVWSSFIPSVKGTLYVDTNGSDYDTVLSVFTGSCLSTTHGCCETGSAGCVDPTIQACVCAADPYCCNTAWDGICAGEVTSLGCGTCPTNDHNCCVTGAKGCNNNTVEACVCVSDPFCCNTSWDGICVGEVASLGCGSCTAASPLACDDDGGNGLNSSIAKLPLNNGTAYLIKVADYNTPGGGLLNFNLTFNTCPADIAPPGGNNVVNVDDLLAVINDWGPCPFPCSACVADINSNCVVNVDDLLALINSWGVCPGDCTSPFVCGGGLVNCAGGDPSCYCWSAFGGGSVCGTDTTCAGIVPCVNGNCPPGFVCATNTCCNGGAPVCVPICGSGGFVPPADGQLTTSGVYSGNSKPSGD